MATQRTPSGRTDNLLYTYGEVSGAVELAARLLRLAAACAESVTVDAGRAAQRVRDGFALATDVAETISLNTGRDYRSAYDAVGRAVADGRLDAAALGVEDSALDPAAALAARTVPGGAAPEPMDAMLAECRAAVAEARRWVEVTLAERGRAEGQLVELARSGSRSSVS
jgi:argininosuccinate lyase